MESLKGLNISAYFNHNGILYRGKLLAKDGNYIKCEWIEHGYVNTLWMLAENVRVKQ